MDFCYMSADLLNKLNDEKHGCGNRQKAFYVALLPVDVKKSKNQSNNECTWHSEAKGFLKF